MKADVQYNDFIGTAAADKTDFDPCTIQSYLRQKGINDEKYEFIGISFYASGDTGSASFSFICKDKEDGEYKEIAFEKEQTFEEFITFFKRFNVILGLKHKQKELDRIASSIETIYLDDRD